jgi:peptide/nickel transport system substrate-binding protein
MHKALRLVTVFAVLVLQAALVFAGGAGETGESAAGGTAVEGAKEAPQLSAMVQAGELPPLEERLPSEPLVIEPVEEIGQYGGTWRRAFIGPSDGSNPARIMHDTFLSYSMDGSEIIPHVAKEWIVSDDGKSVTFMLREGMKWSDGDPMDADDIMFWWEDIQNNESITPTKVSWMRIEGEYGDVEKVDDHTVRFVFPSAYPLIVKWLAGTQIVVPSHYLKEHHPDYAGVDKIEEAAADGGYDEWWQYFAFINTALENPDRPAITAWQMETPITTERMIFERNPYYWKVDTEGNQLPYIDTIQFDFVENIEVLNLRALAGELDMQSRHILIDNYPALMNGRQAGDYRVITWPNSGGSDASLMFNQSFRDDPVIANLLTNREFRIALSHALDRDEINDVALYGLGEPRQLAPLPASPFYVPEHPKRFTEFDPDRANQMLDDLGMTGRDSAGFRLSPEGEQFQLTVHVVPAFGPWRKIGELVVEYWKDVGVNVELSLEERSLHYEKMYANQLHIAMWNSGGAENMFVYPYWTFPYHPAARVGPEMGRWYQSGGEQGIEPTGDIMRLVELHDAAKSATMEERVEIGREIFDINTNNLFTIGTVGASPMVMGVYVVKNNFRNVPEQAANSVVYYTPGNALPEQFFIEQ